MLNIEKVNLYDHYGLEKLPERAGNLTCIYFSTGWEISTSRVRPAVLIMPGGGYHAVLIVRQSRLLFLLSLLQPS